MSIRGTEGLSPADLQAEIARGARFVAYQWCISLLVVTLKRGTRIYYLKPGENGFLPGFFWSLFSLLAGWWGFPWGPIYTIGSLWTNARGGIDVTSAVSADLAANHGAEAPPPLPGSSTGARWSSGALAAIGVFAFAIFAVVAGTQQYASQHRPVALVNGLDTAYTTMVDGVRHNLRPHSVAELELAEGQHTVVTALPGGVGESRFTFTSGDNATVVNPDTAALVAEETSYYGSAANSRAKNPDPVIHCGKECYNLRTPDFFLRDFPSSVSMSKYESRTSRSRLAVYPDIAIDQITKIVLNSCGRPAGVAYLRSLGEHLPNNQIVLSTAAQTLEPTEAKAFFAPHLATRPVLMEWHRYYQHYIQTRQPDVDLHSEYRRLADAEPDEGAFAYLYGRLLDDPAEENVWLERALAAKRPCAFAHGAIAYHTAARGDFAGALAALDRARQAGLEGITQRVQRIECLVALRRFDDALHEFNAQPASATVDFSRANEELHLSYLAGGKPAAKHVIETFLARLPAEARRQSGDSIRKNFESQIAYYEGAPAASATAETSDNSDSERFAAALCRGDCAAAEKALAALPVQNSRSWLMLYLSAKLANNPRAETYWTNTVAAFSREPYGHRRLAAHFAGTTPLAATELVNFPMDSDEKRIFLAALGLREPALRTACFARAAQCNFNRQFPHHLVAAALANAQP